jgi:hypothetical protein
MAFLCSTWPTSGRVTMLTLGQPGANNPEEGLSALPVAAQDPLFCGVIWPISSIGRERRLAKPRDELSTLNSQPRS